VSGNLDEWVAGVRTRAATSGVAGRLVAALARQPERASYASASEMGDLAGINRAGVTRSAQLLGYSGWPELRAELRAQYLSSLSMLEIATKHAGRATGSAARRSYAADQRALSATVARADDQEVARFARVIADGRTRATLGAGSYSTAARLLSMNATLAGYPIALLPEGADATNAIARLDPGDVFVAISFWRVAESTFRATRYAREVGATVCIVTDHTPTPFTEQADHILKVTAEGSAHFPTMVPAIAVVNAICSELAELDPERTRRSIGIAEAAWERIATFAAP
jgi:DNA-binding MurR/RpiR family transcriptional regulator